MHHFLGNEKPATAVLVRRVALESGASSPMLFYKQYTCTPASWRFLGRRSKARCEFRNYHVFASLDIAAAQPIACGEKRDWLGRLRSAFILTREIPDAIPLKEYIDRQKTGAAGRQSRLGLITQLAGMVRRIHEAGFFHHDLVWRNILVTCPPAGEPKIWWIDCPRGRFDRWSPLRRRRRLKDLASLDKVASQVCTARERVKFVKRYLGQSRLDEEAKRFVRAVLEYRRTRWPEDWT